jgi:hypothetical protein
MQFLFTWNDDDDDDDDDLLLLMLFHYITLHKTVAA